MTVPGQTWFCTAWTTLTLERVLRSGILAAAVLLAQPVRNVVSGHRFEIALYKLGDRYLAARSYEYGYANYEVTF